MAELYDRPSLQEKKSLFNGEPPQYKTQLSHIPTIATAQGSSPPTDVQTESSRLNLQPQLPNPLRASLGDIQQALKNFKP